MAENPGCMRIIEESSESENDTEPAKNFHRRLSTKKDIKTSVSISFRHKKLTEIKRNFLQKKKEKSVPSIEMKIKRTSQSKQNFLVFLLQKKKRKTKENWLVK